MTVETTAARQRYIGDGASSQFDFTFPYVDSADIRLTQKVAGVETILAEGSHYSITRVGAGGRVNLGTPFVLNGILSIVRDPSPTQGTDLQNNDTFYLETIENVLDRQAMILQRHADLLLRSIVLAETDLDGSGAFRARGNRLTGLAAGVNASDAATIAQLAAVAGGDLLITPEVIAAITASVIADASLAALFGPINSELGSLAGLIAGLDAQIEALSQIDGDETNIIALITSEQTARIDGDTALATKIARMGALSGDSLAFILDLDTVKVSPTESLSQRLSGIASTLGANQAAILNEATTRTNQDLALAASISTVQSQMGSNTATVQTIQSSVNGILGKYVVKIDNNGYVSGFGLVSEPNNGGVVSAFIVLADQFRIANPGNPSVSPFFVNGGVVYLKNVVIDTAAIGDATITNLKLVNGAVTTEKVQTGAISNMQDRRSSTYTGSFTGVGGDWYTVTDSYCDITTSGAKVQVLLDIPNWWNAIGPGVLMRLVRDGTPITGNFQPPSTGPNDNRALVLVDTPSAGAHRYSLQVYNANSAAAFGEVQFVLTELKK